jgi:hypothetical protein
LHSFSAERHSNVRWCHAASCDSLHARRRRPRPKKNRETRLRLDPWTAAAACRPPLQHYSPWPGDKDTISQTRPHLRFSSPLTRFNPLQTAAGCQSPSDPVSHKLAQPRHLWRRMLKQWALHNHAELHAPSAACSAAFAAWAWTRAVRSCLAAIGDSIRLPHKTECEIAPGMNRLSRSSSASPYSV